MTDGQPEHERFWQQAVLAAACLAINPFQIGGVNLRGSAGPLRARWLEVFETYGAELAGHADQRVLVPVPAHVEEERLLGGLDLAATLKAGKPVTQSGLLQQADGRVLLLRMAERFPERMAAHIAQARDHGFVAPAAGDGTPQHTRFAVVACDEGLDDAEAGHPETTTWRLRDRLGLWIDLNRITVRPEHLNKVPYSVADVLCARAQVGQVKASKAQIQMLVGAAALFGVHSLRAPLQALAVARCLAALRRDDRLTDDDLTAASALVLGPRATQTPQMEADQQDEQDPQQPEEQTGDHEHPDQDTGGADELERLVEAVKAALPPHLLAQLSSALGGRARTSTPQSASGHEQSGAQRGRKIGTRARPAARSVPRLDVLATLRSAAPFQAMRDPAWQQKEQAERALSIQPSDFRYARYRDRSQTSILICVDASGSAALHRLAEAKGAVELLLSDAYSRRDHVGLIGFRGTTAELLLPPTRSLARAKRLLAALPGGGATPLASAIDLTFQNADAARRKNHTPLLVFLTDGRGNVTRDGQRDRTRAHVDALESAQQIALAQFTTCFIDTAPRPAAQARDLAHAMSANYLALPHADARVLSNAIQATRTSLDD